MTDNSSLAQSHVLTVYEFSLRFPKDSTKRMRWIEAIDRKNWKPSNATVICSEHFESDCFYTTQYGLKKLVSNAIPTMKLYFNTEEQSIEEINTTILDDLVPDMPVIADEDPQTTKDLAAQLMKLINIYEKQKKILRNLRQRAKRQELRLYSAGKASVDVDHIKAKRTKSKKYLQTNNETVDYGVYNSELRDPLS
ncbi:DNA transposase THAP9 [Eumeta japonica]|uniref:DNA transposase THAP9 n=1 Tax=Eumeta variegata TaxID=151549 RepID=A0A4C1SVP8_EUMVA|nr:DNA transposase THAP9 [Eumeta japonica]